MSKKGFEKFVVVGKKEEGRFIFAKTTYSATGRTGQPKLLHWGRFECYSKPTRGRSRFG